MPDNETKEQIAARVAAAEAAYEVVKEAYDEHVLDPTGSAQASADDARDYARQAEDTATGFAGHLTDANIHLMGNDRADFTYMRTLFKGVIPDYEVNPPEAIRGATIPDSWFASYFQTHAAPGFPVAPGRVYVSRVPFAYKDATGSWTNLQSSITFDPASGNPDPRKALDNAGLDHTCYTQSGPVRSGHTDDYIGREWAFFWARCNYVKDEFGVKWVTAVEGETPFDMLGRPTAFDLSKPIGIFAPKIWTFCHLDELEYNVMVGDTATPTTQMWGIGDSPWHALTTPVAPGSGTTRQQWLIDHGVTENDYALWPTAKWYDVSDHTWKERSYIIDSAFCGTAELNSSNQLNGISSKLNKPIAYSVSHNTINGFGSREGSGTRACALAMVYDIVKNADKNSQTIHYGMFSNSNNATVAYLGTAADRPYCQTAVKGRIFPIGKSGTTTSTYQVGCTVFLRSASTSSAAATSPAFYTNQPTNRPVRIKAIEEREMLVRVYDSTWTTYTEETQTNLCLVLEDSVPEFYACTTTDRANDLISGGDEAHAYVTQGMAIAGETYLGGANGTGVMGKHDGSVTSNSNGRHPYRVQGLELMGGVATCAGDVVACKGTGSVQVTLPGQTTPVTPSSSEYVYLYAPGDVERKSLGSLSAYLNPDSGKYVAVGVGPATPSGRYIYNGFVEPHYGVFYVSHIDDVSSGGAGSSSTGHGDQFYASPTVAEYISGGALGVDVLDVPCGAGAGSAGLSLYRSLSTASWTFGARD